MNNKPLNYKDAGVDIAAGNKLVDNIKDVAKKTHRKEVMSSLGGFGALFNLGQSDYKEPILVAGTDGVGTKLKLAMQMQQHDTIGIDLVAMCVNDLIVQGAEPLFFLDYYATGKLAVPIATEVVTGIGAGCEQAGCALIGGETAEMPGMYHNNDYDLAGFCVGVVEKEQLITGDKVNAGDSIIALASSGPHSNGYSLIRKILEVNHTSLDTPFADSTLGETLLTPTKIYVQPVLDILQKFPVHAIAHITGGGLLENIPRVLPEHCQAQIDRQSWQLPAIFQWLQEQGNISDHDMHLTFNCGVGLVLVVPTGVTQECITMLNELGEQAWHIGEIKVRAKDAAAIEII